MLETSKDLFWVALSFAIFWVGIAAGFGCFYLALVLRNFWQISSSVKKKIEAVEKIVAAFKGKVESTASFVPPLVEGVTKIVEAIGERKKAKSAKRKEKKK
ncbi:MAG: hypothetical protein WC518_01970 [Patescibacteria group bacterium]